MKLAYIAVFTPCEEGGYMVTVPDLPGCITEGDNLAEALFMAEDAASGWILGELEEGNKVPEATNIEKIETKEGQFKSIIALDMDAYAEKYGQKAVKKTLTIPAWMNAYVEEHNVSCSKILQDAISQMVVQA